MYNAKPMISKALSMDSLLIARLPKIRMFDGSASFTSAPVYPYLTYEELMNIEGHHADDEEIASEVTFRIHIWGTTSLSSIASHVNRIMHTINFGRNYAHDQDEVLENGVIIKHKIMSFTSLVSFLIDSDLDLAWNDVNKSFEQETLSFEMYDTY